MKINKELFILVIGRILQIIILLIALRISTKLLSPDEMGNLYLVLSICSFFGFFFINPVGQYINRKTYEWHENNCLLNKLYIYNYYLIFASILSIFVIYISYSYKIGNSIELKLLIAFIPLYIFFNTWNQTIIPMINMLEKRIIFTIFTIATLLISLLVSFFFVEYYDKTAIYWFTGQIIAYGFMGLIAFIYFVRYIDNNLDFNIAHSWINIYNIKRILIFTLPLAVSVFFVWMQSQSYRIVIEKYIGSEFLGYFGVGMAIALAISSSFETIVMQFLYPKIYKAMKNDDDFKIVFTNIINYIIPIYFVLAVCVSFLSIYITTILVDVKYHSVYLFVSFGIWIEFFRMSTNLISTVSHSKMKTSSLILPNFVGGFIVLFGVYIVSHHENYIFLIPIVLLLAAFLLFILMFYKMNQLIKIQFNLKQLPSIFLYSGVFGLSIFFYQLALNLYYSVSIVFIFGIYFLWVLNNLIRRSY